MTGGKLLLLLLCICAGCDWEPGTARLLGEIKSSNCEVVILKSDPEVFDNPSVLICKAESKSVFVVCCQFALYDSLIDAKFANDTCITLRLYSKTFERTDTLQCDLTSELGYSKILKFW